MIFRRKRGGDEQPEGPELDAESPAERPFRPLDASEVDLDVADPPWVDLGALLITPRPDLELRLQVDEASSTVLAVLLVTEDSGLELRPFAAPRSEGIWAEVRREIAASATQQGGTASEAQGPFGPELRLAMPVRAPDGTQGMQLSRIVGVDGPRWLLRGTFLGAAAEPDAGGLLDDLFREVIVVRGSAPMAPREPLPLSLPAEAKLPETPPAG
jgi:Protein of unknown function (DUF3710)